MTIYRRMMQHNGDWAYDPLHLEYYDPGVGGDFPGKITSGAQLGF